MRIFDAASGKESVQNGNHENWVLGTVFGVDGKRIVSVSRDRAAKITDATSGAFLENLNLLRGELAAIARHRRRTSWWWAAKTGRLHIYDGPAEEYEDCRRYHAGPKLDRQDGVIAALAWSPDGAFRLLWPEHRRKSPCTTRKRASSMRRGRGNGRDLYGRVQPDSRTLAPAGFDGNVRAVSG